MVTLTPQGYFNKMCSIGTSEQKFFEVIKFWKFLYLTRLHCQ